MLIQNSESVPPIKRKKAPGCTILRSLYDREIYGTKTHIVRAAYQTVYPNCTVFDVDKPTPYLKKFTSDGRHLIAFSNDLVYVEVYNYLGYSKATDLLKNVEADYISEEHGVRCQIFEKLFKLKYRIKVATEGQKLNNDCLLFTNSGDHILVGSSAVILPVVGSDNDIPQLLRPQLYEVYSNNESLNPSTANPLKVYTLHLVNINHGTLSHNIHFEVDKIYLTNNEGLYLYNDTLAVLSIQHQRIYVYKIIQNRFCLKRTIGQYCSEDDKNLVASTYTCMNSEDYQPFKENSINGLKHKLMVFLYKKAASESSVSLGKFYINFDHFVSLKMWQMQLIDEDHFLIRYTTEAVALHRINNPQAYKSYFMVYNMITTTVLQVFEDTSDELLKVYINFCDDFCNFRKNSEGSIPSSMSNSLYSRESYQISRNSYLKSNLHRTAQASLELNKLVLNQLPVAAQSYTNTPYFNESFYDFNNHYLSPINRDVNIFQSKPIGFFSRETGKLIFRLYITKPNGIRLGSRTVQLTFHPTEPFAISYVKEPSQCFTNFHLRKVYMPE